MEMLKPENKTNDRKRMISDTNGYNRDAVDSQEVNVEEGWNGEEGMGWIGRINPCHHRKR